MTNGHDAYPGTLKMEVGEAVRHRTNRYWNNHLGQDHRGIKHRTHPICDFKSFLSVERFCRLYEEVRQCFRARLQWNESVSLAWPRALHPDQR